MSYQKRGSLQEIREDAQSKPEDNQDTHEDPMVHKVKYCMLITLLVVIIGLNWYFWNCFFTAKKWHDQLRPLDCTITNATYVGYGHRTAYYNYFGIGPQWTEVPCKFAKADVTCLEGNSIWDNPEPTVMVFEYDQSHRWFWNYVDNNCRRIMEAYQEAGDFPFKHTASYIPDSLLDEEERLTRRGWIYWESPADVPDYEAMYYVKALALSVLTLGPLACLVLFGLKSNIQICFGGHAPLEVTTEQSKLARSKTQESDYLPPPDRRSVLNEPLLGAEAA